MEWVKTKILILGILVGVLAFSFTAAHAQILPMVVTESPEYYETDGFGLTVLKHYGFPTTPYDYLNANLPITSPFVQLSTGVSPYDVVCKEDLELMVKPSKESSACVKTTSVMKFVERNWIHVFAPAVALSTGETNIETEESELEPIQKPRYPSDDQRAMSFVVTFSEGRVPPDLQIPIYTFSKFNHISKVTDETLVLPEKFATTKPQFILQSLPSLDKKPLYSFIDKWIKDSSFTDPFDVKVDIIAGNGEIIQSWAYRDCSLVDYHTYLLENLIVYKFHEKFKSEIRDRISFSCGDFSIEVPEN